MQRWLVFLVIAFSVAYLIRNLRRTGQDEHGCAGCEKRQSCKKAAENKGPCGSRAGHR